MPLYYDDLDEGPAAFAASLAKSNAVKEAKMAKGLMWRNSTSGNGFTMRLGKARWVDGKVVVKVGGAEIPAEEFLAMLAPMLPGPTEEEGKALIAAKSKSYAEEEEEESEEEPEE